MSSWDPIDDLFNDNEPATSETKSSLKNETKLFNEDELDQNELLGLDYDDDFGLDEQKPTNTQQETQSAETNLLETNQETNHVNDAKPQIDHNHKETVQDEQTNEIFEEIENFQCESSVYNDEGLDYDNLLDYGEDDFEIKETKISVQETKQVEQIIETKPIEKQVKVIEPEKPTEIASAKKAQATPSPGKDTVQQPRPLMEEPITMVPKKLIPNEIKQTVTSSFIHPDDLEEDEHDDEEEDEGGVRKKRGRSNNWSERGENNNNGLIKSPVRGQNNNQRNNLNNGNHHNNLRAQIIIPNMRPNNYNRNVQNFNNNNGNGNNFNSTNKFPQNNNGINCFPHQQNIFPMLQNFPNQQNFNGPQKFPNQLQQQQQNFHGNQNFQNQRNFLNQVSPMTQGLAGPAPLLPINQGNGNFMNQQNINNQIPLNNDVMRPPNLSQPQFNNNIMQQPNNKIRRDTPIMSKPPNFISNPSFSNQQIRPPTIGPSNNNRQMNFNQNQNKNNNFINQNGYINPRTDLPMQTQMNNTPHQIPPTLNNFNNNQNINKSPNNKFQGPNRLSNQTSPMNIQNGLLPSPMPQQQQKNFQHFPNQMFNKPQQPKFPPQQQSPAVQFPPNQFVPNMPNPSPAPSVLYNNSNLTMPPPTKPSTVYINPTFIAKQNKLAEQQDQNVLKDINSNGTESDKKPSDAKPPVKQRSRKDLEALLEKRLAAEMLLSNENEKTKTNSVSMKTKRKSFENSNSRNTDNSDSKVFKRSLSSSTNHRSESRSSSSKQIKPLMDEEPPIKKLMSTVVAKPERSTVKNDRDADASEPSVVFNDPEYTKKMEEQKRKREEILRMKEQKRNQRIKEASSTGAPAQTTNQIKSRVKTPEKKEPQTNIRNVIVTSATLATDLKTKPKRIIKPKQSLTTSNVKQLINKTIQENVAVPKQRVMVHNLGATTSEKNLVNLCTAGNLKEKVKLKIID